MQVSKQFWAKKWNFLKGKSEKINLAKFRFFTEKSLKD